MALVWIAVNGIHHIWSQTIQAFWTRDVSQHMNLTGPNAPVTVANKDYSYFFVKGLYIERGG
jgi:hypothetical protein